MASATPLFYAICVIWLHIICLNSTKAKLVTSYSNETQYVSSSNSDRLKRSPMNSLLQQLNLRIRYVTGKEVDLQLVIAPQHLANEYLPVVPPFGYPSEDVMTNVGSFAMYHDLSRCAAVVYFEKVEALYGVVGMSHYIEALPFEFDENGNYRLGVVGEPYVRKIEHPFVHIFPDRIVPPPSDTDAVEDFFRPLVHALNFRGNLPDPSTGSQRFWKSLYNRLDEKKTSMINDKTGTIKNRRDNRTYHNYFLEILIFVTQDIAELFKRYYGEAVYIEWIVRYHIVYFNAVNMIFQTLRTHDGEIHINIAKIVIEDSLDTFDFMMSYGDLQFANLIVGLQQYLRDHRDQYTPDSFDHVFVHTGRTIMDDIVSINARKNGRFYAVVPITVVLFKPTFAHYVVAVHEIGRFGNRNRCFLLNGPRSLQPPGVTVLLSPNRQCQCFGYHSQSSDPHDYHRLGVGWNGCNNPLQCVKFVESQLYHELTVRPFDGTSCYDHKVCWDKECVSLSPVPPSIM